MISSDWKYKGWSWSFWGFALFLGIIPDFIIGSSFLWFRLVNGFLNDEMKRLVGVRVGWDGSYHLFLFWGIDYQIGEMSDWIIRWTDWGDSLVLQWWQHFFFYRIISTVWCTWNHQRCQRICIWTFCWTKKDNIKSTLGRYLITFGLDCSGQRNRSHLR